MTQAIILAAGKSTRCYPLTLTRPKPLLKVGNRTIMEHNLSSLEGLVDEVLLIVGYKKEMIREKFGNRYGKLKLRYVDQEEQNGTAHAALQAEKFVKDQVLIMNGDDLFSKGDIESCLKNKYALLAAEVDQPQRYGVIEIKSKFLSRIVEKPEHPKTKLISPGCYLVSKAIFPIIRKLSPSTRGEYEITDALTIFAQTHKVAIVKSKFWLPNSYVWDLLATNEALLGRLDKSEIKGEIEDGVTIKGPVVVGEGTIIKRGTYIEGPVIIGRNCRIGPNAFIRASTSIGDSCKVGQAVEIKNSILFDNSSIPHLSYFGDSIMGENSNLGAGTISANLRHEHDNVKTMVNGVLVDTGRRKFGTVIADNVHTGIHTSIYPGRKIYPGKITRPGEIVKEDIL